MSSWPRCAGLEIAQRSCNGWLSPTSQFAVIIVEKLAGDSESGVIEYQLFQSCGELDDQGNT